MPSEERFISFDFNEIYKAIVIKCTRDDATMPPPGKIHKIDVTQQGKNGVDSLINIDIKSAKSDKVEQIKMDRTFFAQALVFYCQGSGIPLPRGGQKTLLFAPDKVVMRVVMDGGVSDVNLPKDQLLAKIKQSQKMQSLVQPTKRQDLASKTAAAKSKITKAAQTKEKA